MHLPQLALGGLELLSERGDLLLDLTYPSSMHLLELKKVFRSLVLSLRVVRADLIYLYLRLLEQQSIRSGHERRSKLRTSLLSSVRTVSTSTRHRCCISAMLRMWSPASSLQEVYLSMSRMARSRRRRGTSHLFDGLHVASLHSTNSALELLIELEDLLL